METIRKRHSPKLKTIIALEALKAQRTVNEIASEYKVHPVQVSQWKKKLQDGLPLVFGAKVQVDTSETLVSQLYEEIGRLKFELDWLKKKAARFS